MQHINATTGQAYGGGNQKMLTLDAIARGYKSTEWATFLQWKAAGYMVRKGEKAGGHIVKFVDVTREKKRKDGSKVQEAGKVPRGYAVFNREQVEAIA